jgi:aldehyde dehydrogenase (NAD+)
LLLLQEIPQIPIQLSPARFQTVCIHQREHLAGQIHLNYGSGGADAPFGGYKQSGNGREKAEWGFEEFLEVKAIMGG